MLGEQPEPLTLGAIAQATGLHANTVREHLENLTHRGLVHRTRARPQKRGRPPWLYNLAVESPGASQYAGLAVTLAAVIAQDSATPELDAATAGEEWGHEIARSHHPGGPMSAAEARSRIVTMFDDLGFAPEVDPNKADQVRLTRCPLLQAAHRHPKVVCGVHLGLVRGALEEYGTDPTGTRLIPFSEPGACRLILSPADPTPTSPGSGGVDGREVGDPQ